MWCFRCFRSAAPAMQQAEHRRDEEQGRHRRDQQPADDRAAKRGILFAALAQPSPSALRRVAT